MTAAALNIMDAPENIMDIFLQPGEFYFGDETTRIRTLLGSCVAISIWHPTKKIGGMCHFVLPEKPANKCRDTLSGHYAEDAIELFMHELKKSNTKPSEYQAKLFGGGDMFPKINKGSKSRVGVSRKNMEYGRTVLAKYGFKVQAEHMGGDGHRNIIFDLWNGDVWVRHNKKTF